MRGAIDALDQGGTQRQSMSLGDQLAISSRGNQQALEKQSACTQQQSPARHLLRSRAAPLIEHEEGPWRVGHSEDGAVGHPKPTHERARLLGRRLRERGEHVRRLGTPTGTTTGRAHGGRA